MKKIYIAICLLAALVACSKESPYGEDAVGGRTERNLSYGKTYMMGIADNLVTDVLDELERGIEMNAEGRTFSSHFDISGDLEKTGSVWSVKDPTSIMCGLQIKNLSEGVWELSFEGDYAVDYGSSYPTRFTMQAKREELTSIAYHYCWEVSLEGSRTERGTYSCQVTTPKALHYGQAVLQQSMGGWNQMYGTLRMAVYKGTDLVNCVSTAVLPAPNTSGGCKKRKKVLGIQK